MFLCLSGFTGGGLEGVASGSPLLLEFALLLMAAVVGGGLCESGLSAGTIPSTSLSEIAAI